MQLEDIPLEKLFVSERNDRHAEVDSEEEAVEWLILEFGKRLENLGSDIANSGVLYEPPLVRQEGERYRVHDGNRRIAALKLMKGLISTKTEHSEFWGKLGNTLPSGAFQKISCQIETNQEIIDEILFRRHNGSNEGIGQNDWDDEARQNFLRRTGKQKKSKLSDVLVEYLKSQGKLPREYKVTRSKVDRLFSAKKFQRPFGFEFDKGKLNFFVEESDAIERILKAVSELSLKRVTLADIWDESRKVKFIKSLGYSEEELTGQKSLELSNELRETPHSVYPSFQDKENLKPTKRYAPRQRDRVIPLECGQEIRWSRKESRYQQIWNELEHKLSLSSHPNACAVMLRVLLDILTIDYFQFCEMKKQREALSFKEALVQIVRDLKLVEELDEKQALSIERLIQRDDYLSANALNGWVHDPIIYPSPDHIRQLWNSMTVFLIAASNRLEGLR